MARLENRHIHRRLLWLRIRTRIRTARKNKIKSKKKRLDINKLKAVVMPSY